MANQLTFNKRLCRVAAGVGDWLTPAEWETPEFNRIPGGWELLVHSSQHLWPFTGANTDPGVNVDNPEMALAAIERGQDHEEQ